MKKLTLLIILCFTSELFAYDYPTSNTPQSNPVVAYEGKICDNSEVMVPIPSKDRIYNKTGIQCVWATLETLGKYAGEKKLFDLTSQKDCQQFGSPKSVYAKLKKLNVKFEQTTEFERTLIIKSVVRERRGCLFSVKNHVMTLVHYDEANGIVKYINNSDSELKIREWTLEEFNKRWDGWICVIYADRDIIPIKYIPVIDRNGRQNKYSDEYILQPK